MAKRKSGNARLLLSTLGWVTLPYALVMGLAVFVAVRSDSPVREAKFRQSLETTAERIAATAAGSLQWGDLGRVEEVLREFMATDGSLATAEVLDLSGKVVARAQSDRAVEHTLTVTSELRRDEQVIGTLRATFDSEPYLAVERSVQRAGVWGTLFTLTMSILIAVVVSGIYRRAYEKVLTLIRGSAGELDRSVERLQAATTSQSAYTAQSASALAETQAVAAEVGNATATGAGRAASLAEVGAQTDQEAERATALVIETRDALAQVGDQTAAIGAAIRGFNDKGAQIGEIATTVAGLADRSNLLALNAAIEASRAGENGKAFSVVSREMRKLAEATRRSAADVKQVVADVQEHVARWTQDAVAGERQVAQAAARATATVEALRGFSGATRQLAEMSRGLSAGGNDQRSAIESTVEAMKQASAAGAEQLDGVRSIEGSAGRLRSLSASLLSTLDEKDLSGTALEQQRHRTAFARRLVRRTLAYTVVPYALMIIVTLTVMIGTGMMGSWSDPREAIERNAESLAVAMRDPARRMDRPAVRALLSSANIAAPLLHAEVRRADGEIVAALGSVPPAGTPAFIARRDLRGPDGTVVGAMTLTHSRAEADATLRATQRQAVFISLGGILTVAVMALIFSRRFGSAFEKILDRARNASTQLDALVSGLAAAASQQSSSMAESAAALQETHASAAEVRRGAAKAREQANRLVEDGASAEAQTAQITQAITALEESVVGARGQARVLAEGIAAFSDRAAAIAELATAVALLAERSDLLAVNASIESARGGASATSGFMVVAEEIRSLADGSARAAQQVKTIVDAVRLALSRAQVDAQELQRRLEGAERAAQNAREGVARFADVTRQFVRLGNDLGVSAAQQQNAVDQMAEAVKEAADGARSQAQSTREVDSVAQGLVALSKGLVQVTAGEMRMQSREAA